MVSWNSRISKAKQTTDLPPMQNEPNQAEIDRQQADLFRQAAAEQKGKSGSN